MCLLLEGNSTVRSLLLFFYSFFFHLAHPVDIIITAPEPQKPPAIVHYRRGRLMRPPTVHNGPTNPTRPRPVYE